MQVLDTRAHKFHDGCLLKRCYPTTEDGGNIHAQFEKVIADSGLEQEAVITCDTQSFNHLHHYDRRGNNASNLP